MLTSTSCQASRYVFSYYYMRVRISLEARVNILQARISVFFLLGCMCSMCVYMCCAASTCVRMRVHTRFVAVRLEQRRVLDHIQRFRLDPCAHASSPSGSGRGASSHTSIACSSKPLYAAKLNLCVQRLHACTESKPLCAVSKRVRVQEREAADSNRSTESKPPYAACN